MDSYTPFEVYLENLFRKANPAHNSSPKLTLASHKSAWVPYQNLLPRQYYSSTCPHSSQTKHTQRQHILTLPAGMNETTPPTTKLLANCMSGILTPLPSTLPATLPSTTPPRTPNSSQLPTFMLSPLMTSTPVEVANGTTPPRSPRAASPPQFFFPPDFPLLQGTELRNVVPSPETPVQTRSSFGKSPKLKRRRTKFNTAQLDALEQEFDDCSYISIDRRRIMAVELGITSDNIRVWFQNRRHLLKKMQNDIPKMA